MQCKPITCKLHVHDKNFNEQDVILYKELPGLVAGDIIEVYHPDGDYSRLLVKVNELHNENQQKQASVSIQQGLATSFFLRQYNNVIVNKVDKASVTLDSVELIIKDAFLTRSDAWRLNRLLIGSCVYLSSKVDFLNTRLTVNELLMRGDQVTCGVVDENTKMIFRSASSKFHIFVQMSAEMWEFDYTGELFFEKAIMSFLQDLFNRWKSKDLNCNHDVVIVLFSRTYYNVQSIDELSPELQKEVLRGHDGRFYQDFYKVIRQSEKQDNLQNVILDLKRSFHGYPLHVNCRQPFAEGKSPTEPEAKGMGVNSRATEGNLLEAINLSLNVFEKNYINCNLEEMNYTTLIISPSSGVFEVDEELTTLTKKRLIDNGVGIDLVCLAPQPLHAVPLIKFVSKSRNGSEDIYNVPQWINPSYYYKQQPNPNTFVPRLHVPERPHTKDLKLQRSVSLFNETTSDYDEYDAKVFDYCKSKKNYGQLTTSRSSISTTQHQGFSCYIAQLEHPSANSSPEVSKSFGGGGGGIVMAGSSSSGPAKKMSVQEDIPMHMLLRSVSEDPTRNGPSSFDDLKFTMDSDKEDTPKLSTEHLFSHSESISSGSGVRTTFNPFKPRQMAKAVTLFRHRWLHNFPQSIKVPEQQQQHVATPKVDFENAKDLSSEDTPPKVAHRPDFGSPETMSTPDHGVQLDNTLADNTLVGEDHVGCDNVSYVSNSTVKSEVTSLSSVFPLQQQDDWTTSTFTGVDWKSLCLPSCLPLTINYFPEETTLNNQYFEYNYTMVMEPDEIGPDGEKIRKEVISVSRFDRTALSPEKKFMEMISQRIARGFQFVTDPLAIKVLKLKDTTLQSMEFNSQRSYVLSIGLTIHHLLLKDADIYVTRYSLRDPIIPKPMIYRYNVWPYNILKYAPANAEFSYESPNQYSWNSVDRYICDTEKEYTQLTEHMKYWRTRFLLLPVKKTSLNPNVTIHNASRYNSTHMVQIEGFLRLLESMNKIKRGPNSRHLFSTRNKTHPSKQRRKSSKEKGMTTTPERKESKSSLSDKRTSPIHIEPNFMPSINSNTSDFDQRSSSSSSTFPSEMPPEHSLSINSSLGDIIKVMLNPEYGLTFIPKQENLRDKTFISAEAVAWMIKCIDDCNTKNDALALGQRLLENKLILHASESSRQCFVDGFYLYFIKEEKKEDEPDKRRFWFSDSGKKTEEELLSSYNIQWLEVAVWKKIVDKDHVTTFLQDPLPRDIADKKKAHEEGAVYSDSFIPLYRKMEYNPDINQKSCRSEWCVISYHGNYYPSICAYAIEMNWMVASGVIIADLVQKWSHKAAACGVHIVPAPMCVFPRHTIRCSRNPFRKNPFIHLNVDCLLEPGQAHLFQKFDRKTWHRRMIFFQEAILYKFDFIRDIPQTGSEPSRYSSCKSFQYIHTSGSIFVKINDMIFDEDPEVLMLDEDNNSKSPFGKRRPTKRPLIEDKYAVDKESSPGFFWVYNYALTEKWRSNSTGTVPVARAYMREKFTNFCDNKDNQLVDYWNSVNEVYERELKDQQLHQ